MSREGFQRQFGYEPDFCVEVPGRTELGGNHTDHQHGCVIAAPVDLKMRAWVRGREDGSVHVCSEGYGSFMISLDEPESRPEECGKPEALVRGITASFAADGLKGFDAYIVSDVPAGSGLSSSAAFEILLGRICCLVCGAEKSGTELAQLGQRVENAYFGKPCGLMDQMACASEGIIAIDFEDPAHPKTKELQFSFLAHGYNVCLVKCGAGHEDMTEDYAAITRELASVCACFGKTVLREVPEDAFYDRIAEVRQACGDRAVLRAIHVYEENRRVTQMTEALEAGDMDRYLQLVQASGASSRDLLQNIVPGGASAHQDMAFALTMAEKALNGQGAVRVHGGGFAGTIQAYVPLDRQDSFKNAMESLLGAGSCIFLNI
jgi:galactokinase